jgi:hypothetical protein
VLSDAVVLPSIFEHALAQYVAKGGSVLIALGTAAAHSARIPLWGSDLKDVHEYARTGNPATVGQVDFSYPALAQEQPGPDNGGWADVRIFCAAALDVGQAAWRPGLWTARLFCSTSNWRRTRGAARFGT